MKKNIILYSIIVMMIGSLTNCGIADLRTDLIKNADAQQATEISTKGRILLDAAYKQQGLDQLAKYENYSFIAHEKWKGLIGKGANPWGTNDIDMRFSYRIGSFDGRVEFLSGEKKGRFHGLQSWKYYEGNTADGMANFEVKENSRIVFSISAYQYFVELLARLRDVPVVEYAGEKSVGSETYDLVLATWGDNSIPTKQHDQYLVYINQQTGMMDYCSYSAHDNEAPGSSSITATIRYSDYQNIGGVLIPMLQEVMLAKPKENKKTIHEMKISSFEFDVVADDILLPNAQLPLIGDTKL